VAPLFRALAHWHAGAKRWGESADYYHLLLHGPARQSADFFDKLVTTNVPPSGVTALMPQPWSLVYFEYAPLLIELKNLAGYRKLCALGTARYAHSTVPNVCEIMMHVTLIIPPEKTQMATIDRWARHAAANQWATAFFALALYHYRQGRDETALVWCDKCLAGRPHPALAARTLVLQSMIHWHLKNRELADKEFAQARDAINQKFRGQLGVGTYGGDLWADWLMSRILLREAEAMLKTRTASDNQDGDWATSAASGAKLVGQDPALLVAARMKGGHELRRLAGSAPWKGPMRIMAEATFRAAADVFRSVTVDQPDHSEAWHYLADTHRRLGDVLVINGDFDKAETEFRRALELFNRHAAAFDSQPVNVVQRADAYFVFAALLARTKRSAEAVAPFRQGCEIMEASLTSYAADQEALNELAWQLATSAEPLRDPVRAVELAQKAVAIDRRHGGIWNTLGVAYYYAGQSQEAIRSFERSMERRSGGDPHDWLFLAMAHWRLGHREEARNWYDKAVEWMDASATATDELQRFRAEATELLGVRSPQSADENVAPSYNQPTNDESPTTVPKP
jgi:tetratricopeptide (TPR) repeat protein